MFDPLAYATGTAPSKQNDEICKWKQSLFASVRLTNNMYFKIFFLKYTNKYMNKYNLIFWAVSHVDKTLEEPTLGNGSVD